MFRKISDVFGILFFVCVSSAALALLVGGSILALTVVHVVPDFKEIATWWTAWFAFSILIAVWSMVLYLGSHHAGKEYDYKIERWWYKRTGARIKVWERGRQEETQRIVKVDTEGQFVLKGGKFNAEGFRAQHEGNTNHPVYNSWETV